MSTWKKALSTLATAGLLASLLGSAFAATTSAADYTEMLDLDDCTPASCSAVAGSYVTVAGNTDGTDVNGSYAFSITGGTFLGAGAGLKLYTDLENVGGIVYPKGYVGTTAPNSLTDGSYLQVYSATVGEATITELTYSGTAPNGAWVATGNTYKVSFYAASDLQISSAKSFAKIVVGTGPCALNTAKTGFDDTAKTSAAATSTDAARVCVRIENGNGDPVTGATLTGTISPVGAWVATNSAVIATGDWTEIATKGVYYANIRGNALPGTATVSVTATRAGLGTITVSPGTFVFTGKVASITAKVAQLVCDASGSDPCTGAVTFTAKDSAGNLVETVGASASASTTAPFTPVVNTQFTSGKASTPGKVNVTCDNETGSGTVTVKQTVDGKTIASSPVTLYCSGAADTWSVAFAKSTVAPGGNVGLNLTAKDEDGQPAYLGGLGKVLVTTSTGSIVAGTELDNGDGTWTWTYLAPFNTGVATAAVYLEDLDETKYASINVTTVVPVSSGITVRVGTGAYSASSKVARVGQTVTWRGALGADAAGKSVSVYVRTRSADGTVGTARKWATKTASSTGVVTFSYRSSSVRYIQIKFVSGAATTSWLGARWR